MYALCVCAGVCVTATVKWSARCVWLLGVLWCRELELITVFQRSNCCVC